MNKLNKLITFLTIVAVLLSSFSCIAFADVGDTIITVDKAYGSPEGTVDVNVNIENNPGILGATFSFSYDNDSLTLVKATAGDAFSPLTLSKPGEFKSPCKFTWDGMSIASEDIKDGVILTLTFNISENAIPGNNIDINISYSRGDIVDGDLTPVYPQVVSGSVKIIDYTPGDVDGDNEINARDIVLLRRYITGGYNAIINEYAADVNDDGKINTTDIILIRRYIAGGYGVKLKPSQGLHEHEMQAFAYKAATCTEDGNSAYWYCDLCENYFSDADGNKIITYDDTVIKSDGHNSIAFEAVPATSTTEGYTAGVWCDKCETWIYGHEVIPPIAPNESNVSYRHYVRRENSNGSLEIVNDEYLSTHEIVNPNPVTYAEGTGISELVEGVEINGKKVSANGYSFLGWYEKPELTANRVYSISAEATGNKILYGIWSKNEYKITYLPDSASSTLPRVEDGSYTIDKETSLQEPPKWPNLVWIGWSNDDGEIVKSIPKGTTGDITLTANWMSKRSQTVPNTKYSTAKPAIVTDAENGIYAFTYEIGDIQNVPIQQVEEGAQGKGFNLVKGMTHQINQTFTQKIESSEATSVADTIANATTKSDSWTLSENWNKSTSFSQEHSNEISQEQSQKAAMSFSESGKYSLSSGVGGSKEHIDETGSSTKTTSKHEFGVSVNAGVKADIKAGVTAATPFKNASVEASVGLDYKYSNETEKQTNEKHTDKTSSYWNVDEGFETSQTMSQSAEFAQSLSQSIKDTYKYGETLDFGGSNSNTVSSSNTSSESREYASSVTYSTEEGKSITVVETLTADAETGFYRKVLAANFKVFAVVIYDMKTNTFSTMTYSLKINNSEHLFTDYSTVSSFNDYENGVLPFEVPSFVSDYVYGLVGASEGLKIDDETGIVESYGYKDPATGICYLEYDEVTDTYSNPCDTDVIIPRYIVINVGGNQKKIVPVTGIAAGAFSGTTVTSVYLSDRITSIPDGAFENCTSLKYVRGGTIDTIGANAFKNCTSLFEFNLPNIVRSIGVGAFDGVNALTVNVSSASVLDESLATGVKRLSLNLEQLEDTIDGKKIVTPESIEYFSLSGGGKTFNNVSVESNANTVILNNITINNNIDVPLKLGSENVELGFTSINSNSLIMRLDAENTTVTLDGNNYLTSLGENAVLSRNVRFIEKDGSSASGKLRVTGNVLVFGTAVGTQRVSFDSDAHNFVYLTQEEYENMLNSHFIRFDANGGTVETDSKLVMWNSEFGELPTPVRDNCTFLGWFTNDGTKVTESSVFTYLTDITVRARWQSDWVLADSLPDDASVTTEKWTYDLTTNITSDQSYVEGYTLYNTTSVWGDYGAWSSWSKTSASASDSRQVETKTVTDRAGYTNYKYWIYRTSDGYGYGTQNYYTGSSHGSCTIYDEINLSYSLPLHDSSLGLYGPYNSSKFSHGYDCYWFSGGSSWVPAVTHTEYRYRDRQLVYTYYHTRTESMESSTEVVPSDNISNVQKWVQYVIE